MMPHFDHVAVEERIIAAHQKLLCLLLCISGKQHTQIAIANPNHHGCIVGLGVIKPAGGLRRKDVNPHSWIKPQRIACRKGTVRDTQAI